MITVCLKRTKLKRRFNFSAGFNDLCADIGRGKGPSGDEGEFIFKYLYIHE